MVQRQTITIYHSPDADDAFMFYGLQSGAVTNSTIDFKHGTADIESLNGRALSGELEVSALSVHAFAYLKGRYAILRSGASMGGIDYGPVVIARESFEIGDSKHRTFAIPGERTSAALAFRMFLKDKGINAELVNIHFDEIQNAVRAGKVDGGIIIHEGQITHAREGFSPIVNLGQWWWEDTRLPLPLGITIIRKDLGEAVIAATAQAIKASIEYGLRHRREAIEYALGFGRGISYEEADRFIDMYVNERTRDLGSEGIESITRILSRGAELGLVPPQVELQFV